MDFSKNAEEVQSEILSNIPENYEKRQGFYLYDITKGFAFLVSNILKKLTLVVSKMDVDYLKGSELDKFIYQRTGLERKQATYATGVLEVKGNGEVKKGDVFETLSGLRFESIENKEINGALEIKIRCIEAGKQGNVIANTINKIPITIQGIISVNNLTETSGGYEEESDADYRKRYFEKLREPTTSGNVYHYKKWAKEVEGVGDAKVFPLWNGNNTVKVLIINSERKSADNLLVEKVQNYIDPEVRGNGEGKAPIGAFCTVESAKVKKLNISISIQILENENIERIKREIKEEVENYLATIAFNSQIASYAIIGARILNIKGVVDYNTLLVNGVSRNAECSEYEIFELEEIIVNV